MHLSPPVSEDPSGGSTPGAATARRVSRSVLLALGCALTLGLASTAHAQTAQDIADRVHREGGYGAQLRVAENDEPGAAEATFPAGGTAGEDSAGAASGTGSGGGAGKNGSQSSLPFFGGGSKLVSYVLLACVALVLAGLLFAALFQLRPRGLHAAPRAPEPEDVARSEPPVPKERLDPDELAAAGRYEEALAALLSSALEHVGWSPRGAGRSRTTREVLSSLDPHDARRPPLSELSSIQERVAFAGARATRERFERARERWAELMGSPAEPR